MGILIGIDTYDVILGGRYQHLNYSLVINQVENISSFEFDSRVFSGFALNPFIGSIIEPDRTIKFFPATNSFHYIYTHFSNNVTSIKKAIRAVMPTNFITEPHWILVYGILDYVDINGNNITEAFYSSTAASASVDTTYEDFVRLLDRLKTDTYGQQGVFVRVEELSVVIRREM